jgi:predicted small metal-binding protein
MKELHCKEVGMPNCDFVARGKDDDEVMTKAAEHAKRDHNMQSVPPDLERKARGVIRESGATGQQSKRS